uniref:Uncharacterized protein n=1 Tax=Arundo donax TaxID=35708 RepID=A0A0A9FEX8_ARUDO
MWKLPLETHTLLKSVSEFPGPYHLSRKGVLLQGLQLPAFPRLDKMEMIMKQDKGRMPRFSVQSNSSAK